MALRFNLNLFIKILIPFVLTQFLAIFVARVLLAQGLALHSPAVVHFDSTTILNIAIWLLIVGIFILVSIKFRRFGALLYRLFLIIAILGGVQTILLAITPVASFLLALLLLIVFLFVKNPLIHNLTMVLTLAGLAIIFGLALTPLTAVGVLALLSVYDIVAVYKTGHMVKLAQMMIEARAVFGFIIPQSYQKLHQEIGTIKPGSQYMILGSGDVLLPAILAVSLVPISVVQSVVVISFACLGLLLMNLLFQNQTTRRPMAALPPIAMAAIIGYLIALL